MFPRAVFCIALAFLLMGCAAPQGEAPEPAPQVPGEVEEAAGPPAEGAAEAEVELPEISPPDDAECETDAECPAGKTCFGWKCVSVDRLEEAECEADLDCLEGRFCLHGRCILWQGRPFGPDCELDGDCTGTSNSCEYGYCMPIPTEEAGAECITDYECGMLEYCYNGYCLACEERRGYECMEDDDCPGSPCVDGLCIPLADEGPEAECAEDADCAEGELCRSGQCAELPGAADNSTG